MPCDLTWLGMALDNQFIVDLETYDLVYLILMYLLVEQNT